MIPLRRLALALLLCLALVAGASALDGYTYSQTVEYAACDQAVYQQDLVIHRSAGTAYEETSGGLNIWHLYVGTDCQADYGDLRFTDAAGTELDYWLQPGYDSSSARFCVRLTGATSADSVTAWYGNAGATSESSSGVFDLYHGAATTQFYDSPSLVFSSMIYEASVRRTSTGNINTLLGVANGLFTAPSSDDAMIQLDTDTAKVYYYSTNEGSRTSLSKSFSFEVNTYYNVKLVHNGTHIVGYIDNIAINTTGIGGGHLPNEQVGLFFHPIFAGVGDQAWSCVRRYSAAPPAATAFLTGAAPETPPVAAFTADVTSGVAPLTVQFTDASTNAPTAWSWNFGDGGTSDQQHPSHTYNEPGTYTVALTATNAYGEDTETKTGVITVYSAGPRYVATYEDLCKVGTGTDGWTLDASYVQTADIQCPAESNFPRIGLNPGTPFTGTYDGRGYVIRDLQMNYADFHTGMFIYIGSAGTVQNVTLTDVDVTCTTSRSGALVGESYGTISGCTVSGTITGSTYSGGLVGMMADGAVTNSQSSCTVISGDQSGGLIGYMTGGTVTQCSASGTVVPPGGSVYSLGGLIGYMEDGTITDCHASGTVGSGVCHGGSALGGLVGRISGGSITDSSASGDVDECGGQIGGLIGNGDGGSLTRCSASGSVSHSHTGSGATFSEYCGGLVGYSNLVITECYASGAVGGGYFVGGLVGNVVAGQVSDSYATGAVTANAEPYGVGGLVGTITRGTVSSSYATGLVSASGASAEAQAQGVGGLIGYLNYPGTGITENCFWNTETTGQAASRRDEVGKTTAELQALATFADWSIANAWDHTAETWFIVPGEDYPRLAWEGLPPYDTSVSHYRGARGDKFGSGRYAPEGPEAGSLAWTYQTGDPIKNSPVVGPNGNIVFRGASGTVYCISPDGNLVWTHASPEDDYIEGSVGIDNSGNIYFGYWSSYDFPDPTSPGDYSPSGGYLCSLASDGSVRWQTDRLSNGYLASQSPVIQNGMVYIVPSSNVLAFNCADGSLVWASGYSWQTGYGASVGKDGTIIVTPAQTNRLMSLGPLTGSLNWQAALTYPIDVMYVYSGLPTISPETGVIYIPGEHFRADGVFERYYVINAIGPDGTRLWETAEDPSSAPSKSASLAVGLLAVYSVWEDGSLRAHDLSTGEQLWSLPGSFYGGARPSPVLDGADTVYIGGTDGYFYAIASDGSEKWKYNIGSEYINSATIGNDGTVYVTTQSGDLYAFSAPPLVAAFSAAPTTGTAPLTVQFTDASTGSPTSRSWTFGDGRTSTAQSPAHTYAAAGTYTVVLTVTNAGGSDTETKAGYITVSAAPTPTPPPSSAHSLPYSQQRKETLSFLLMCWGGLAFVGVFCVVIFLLMNGAQRGSGGI